MDTITTPLPAWVVPLGRARQEYETARRDALTGITPDREDGELTVKQLSVLRWDLFGRMDDAMEAKAPRDDAWYVLTAAYRALEGLLAEHEMLNPPDSNARRRGPNRRPQ